MVCINKKKKCNKGARHRTDNSILSKLFRSLHEILYATLIHSTHRIFHTEVADDHADNKETEDHDDKKDAKDSTDRGYFL